MTETEPVVRDITMSEFGQVTENITLNTVDIDTHTLEMQPLVDEDLLYATLQSLQAEHAKLTTMSELPEIDPTYTCVSCQKKNNQ